MASGARGWFVARVLARVIVTALLLFGGFLLSRLYTEDRASLLGGVFAFAAIVYVNLKLRRKRNAELGAAPNCGPAPSKESSGVMGGPQSVS
jgi:hypothetical protein